MQAVWDDVETIVMLLGRCFGGHGLAGCICQFAVRAGPAPPLRTNRQRDAWCVLPPWQLTLQPEWRKNAKDVLRNGGLSTETEQSARDVACLNGDPFNMIIQQLNSVIMSWIESGVNDFVIRPVNSVVHELNHVVEDVDDVVGGVVNSVKSIGNALNPLNWFGRRLDDAEFDDIPMPDFEALKRIEAGRRLGMDVAELDNFSRHVYEDTGYGRRLASFPRAGVPLRMAGTGERPNGRRKRRKLGAQDSHVGMAPSGILPYIPYIDDLCLNDPLKPNKPCMFGEVEADWDACEKPELAGGLDLMCYYQRVTPATLTRHTPHFEPRSILAKMVVFTVGKPVPRIDRLPDFSWQIFLRTFVVVAKLKPRTGDAGCCL